MPSPRRCWAVSIRPSAPSSAGSSSAFLLNMLSYLSQYGALDWFTEELRLPTALLIILVRPARARPWGPVRQAGGEASLTPRTQQHHRVRRLRGVRRRSSRCLPAFVSDFKAREYAYVGIYLIALLGLNILTGYTGQISLGHGAFMAIGGYTTGDPHGRQRAVRRADLRRHEGSLDAARSRGSSQALVGLALRVARRCGSPASTSRSRPSRSRWRCRRP